MSTKTTNYDLIKPALTDKINIADINDSMDIIDNQMHENKTDIDTHTSDTTIHVTTTEKTGWSDKYTKSEINELLAALKSYTDNYMHLKSNAGVFSCTVQGFVNPVWDYNGKKISGNTANFTIFEDGDIVKLTWDSAESETRFIVNSTSSSIFATRLADFRQFINYYLNLTGVSNITGRLAELGDDTPSNTLNLRLCTNVSGNLSTDLTNEITNFLRLDGCQGIVGAYTPTTVIPATNSFANTGMSASDMDATLNAYAALASTKTGTFMATGMTRTAASDTAVATLTAAGWTVSGLTKID